MVKISALKSDSEPAPVLWMCHDCGGADQLCPHGNRDAPLYTSPPTREWVGLTDKDIDDCYFAARQPDFDIWAFAQEVEEVLKQKNT
jgi:hypothetical protein